jgi:hypothetical protein
MAAEFNFEKGYIDKTNLLGKNHLTAQRERERKKTQRKIMTENEALRFSCSLLAKIVYLLSTYVD